MACEFLFEGNWYTEDELRNVFAQTQGSSTITIDGQTYQNNPRIRFYAAIGSEIRNSLPAVPQGFTRLWRGNRTGEIGKNPSFTNSLEGIALPFHSSYKGQLSYVDVRSSDLGGYENKIGTAEGSEFTLPQNLAASAKAIPNSIWDKYVKKYPNMLLEEKNTQPSKASKDTIKKMKEFLDRIGVDLESVAKIQFNGNTLGINGIAIPLQNLIQVVEGKEDVALTEEAMHMAVELLEQKNPKLFKEMMDRIGRYNLYDRVAAEYQNNPFYQKDGKPNVLKIKKETIGKVLAQTVINKNQDANEKPSMLNQTRTWWQQIIDFLKDLFLRAGFNPFESAATQVLSGKLEGSVTSTESPFANRNPNAVNASMKLVASLRDPRATKWFDSLYKKGQKDVFFTKLQQDLQAPRGQVELLKKWISSNDPQSINDIVTGVLSELSYTVEVSVTTAGNKAKFNEDWLENWATENEGKEKMEENPTQHYSSLTVPGGTNYRENEIKTPGITPSIKGHAAFASDKGIGWFRQDDRSIDFNKMIEAGLIKQVEC